jgi:glycosyltransferase involved in cell wall biosynthesis
MPYAAYERWKTTPVTGTPFLSVVIPAYNEEERIVPTIGAIASHLSNLGIAWELLVADDGSSDHTVELVETLELANLRLLKAEQNGGKGSAVQRGMLAARGSYVLFVDADNSTPIEELEHLLRKLIVEGYDIAIGSRAAAGAQETHRTLLRRVVSGGLRRMVGTVLGSPVRDTQCGFKLFTRAAARHLFGAQTIRGFSFDLEILYLAAKFGYRVAEVPVSWVDAPGSKVRPLKEARRFLRDLAHIRLNDLRGAYKQQPGRKLHIAIVTTYPPGQGSLNEYAYHFVRHLRQKPEVRDVTLLLDELPPDQHYSAEPEGAALHGVTCWRFGAWDNPLRILRAVRRTRPDVVLFNIQFASFGSQRIPATIGLLTPALLKAAGFPTIVLLHNIMETVDLQNAGFARNALIERLIRRVGTQVTRMLLRADMLALTVPKYVDILEQKYQAHNVWLAPHGAFEDGPPPTRRSKERTPQVMTFGKFGTYKKVEPLIEAHTLLRSNGHPDLELVIAGTDSPNTPGYLDSVRQRYPGLKGTHFTGYVAEEDVPDVFGAASVVVFPYTSTTGSSGVLHQAGSYSKAVVLPNLGDLAELITEEGYGGAFFEPGDPRSLADAIARVIDHPDYRQALETQNFLAARGLPMSDVVDWYLLHMQPLVRRKRTSKKGAAQ